MSRVGADWHSRGLERKGKLLNPQRERLLICSEGGGEEKEEIGL